MKLLNLIESLKDKNGKFNSVKIRFMSEYNKNIILNNSNCPTNNILENIYWLINSLNDYPKSCKTCGKKITKFENCISGYKIDFCGLSCMQQNHEIQNKKIRTTKLKYGVDYISQCDYVKLKKQETCIKRYGVQSPLHSGEIRNKIIKTWSDTYGTNHPLKSSIVQSKRIATLKRYFIEDIINLNPNVTPKFLLEQYDQHTNYLEFKCNKCNNLITTKPVIDIKCPKCDKIGRNNFESIFIKKLLGNISNEQFLINKALILDYKTYYPDIFFKEKKLIIELNGNYWHSELVNKNKNIHIDKLNAYNNNGLTCLHFFEDEILNKSDIIISMIAYKLNQTKITIDARKCVLQLIDLKSANKFYTENHIQGECKSSINVGLFYKDELISALGMSKSRFSKKYEWEIVRFCSKKFSNVRGAFNKLLTFFIVNNKPESIITYSDRRYSNGNLYLANGFSFLKQNRPNYFYLNKHNYLNRISRLKFQKHKLINILQQFDINLSEWENMQLNGYNRIWDCGTLAFGMTPSY